MKTLPAQVFDVSEYRRFMETHADMTPAELRAMYPAPDFRDDQRWEPSSALYFDSIATKLELTPQETDLLARNGFMVTERLQQASFGTAFLDIYHDDLPVFVASDAILYALHRSYSRLLVDVERHILKPQLIELLETLHAQLPALTRTYGADARLQTALHDLDLYLTVPLRLLETDAALHFEANRDALQQVMGYIEAERPVQFPLFAETPRQLDFSQFKPRGHYVQHSDLQPYFRAMMWLGRTEIYLTTPKNAQLQPSPADIQRQVTLSYLVGQALSQADAQPQWEAMDQVLRQFIGESDNVTPTQLMDVFAASGIESAGDIHAAGAVDRFHEELASRPFSEQMILSQILMGDPITGEPIEPASAFLLLGQRFVVDSYITGQVVHDKVSKRMLPASEDVMFTLGNNFAAELLRDDLESYQYAPHLAGLRYLLEHYEAGYWDASMYNAWLHSIGTLSEPPAPTEDLPRFMQTRAWACKNLNTQLASWAQLRHDNLLYAKQSYSGGITCSFPYSYVEPVPAFYRAVAAYHTKAGEVLANLPVEVPAIKQHLEGYIEHVETTMERLAIISEKELAREGLSDAEKIFLRKMIYDLPGVCGDLPLEGWYPRLFYRNTEGNLHPDYTIVDIHTAPTDENGNPVGWVKHAATGPVQMGVFLARKDGQTPCAYVGPVMSFYEHTTRDFERLTNEEWLAFLGDQQPARPAFAQTYLAHQGLEGMPQFRRTGLRCGEPDTTLPVDVPQKMQTGGVSVRSFPNPFQEQTMFEVSIPARTGSDLQLEILDAQGRLVHQVVRGALEPGRYLFRWQPETDLPPGLYTWRLTHGEQTATGKLILAE